MHHPAPGKLCAEQPGMGGKSLPYGLTSAAGIPLTRPCFTLYIFHIPRPFRWPHCRAGRRGKDSQGSVVLMRSRFEDCIEAHRLLLSPMDGIQSQFK